MRWLLGEPARDDRGAVIETVSIQRIRAADLGKAPTALAKQLKAIIKQRARGWDPMNLVVSLFIAIPFLVVFVLLRVRGLPYFAVLAVFAVANTRFIRWAAERRMAREVAGTIAAHGLCGSCGYTMQDLPTDPDGCVVCPECGSAWAEERMTRAHWRPDKAPLLAARTFSSWVLLALPGLGADARGVLHRRIDTRLSSIPAPARAARPAQAWAALRRDLRRIGRPGRIALSVPVFVLLACCVRWLALEILSPYTDVALAVFLAVTIPFLAYVGAAILCSEWWMPRERIEQAFVRHGACPVCATALAPRESPIRPLMACEGCGCAWRAGAQSSATRSDAAPSDAAPAQTEANAPDPEAPNA